MYSKIKIGGHPLHQMIIVYPIAFYTAALICFIVYSFRPDPFWFRVAIVSNGAGIVSALIAALPGFIDWLGIPGHKRAKKVGLVHLVCNVTALILFTINFFLQYQKWNDPQPDVSLAILLTGLGFILTAIAGFLGGSLILNHHVGVSLTDEQKRFEPENGVKNDKD